MAIMNIINWLSDLFLVNKTDNNLIGLSQLKEKQIFPKQTVKIKKKNKEIKISDLMRGENY